MQLHCLFQELSVVSHSLVLLLVQNTIPLLVASQLNASHKEAAERTQEDYTHRHEEEEVIEEEGGHCPVQRDH